MLLRKLSYYFSISLLTTSLLTTLGCTAKLASKPIGDETADGLVYQLPVTEIKLKLTHKLVECGSNPDIRLVKADYSTSLLPDNSKKATFVLDTTKLQEGNKAIPEAKISMTNNMITGINYKAEDKTAEIMIKVAEIVAATQGIALPVSNKSVSTIQNNKNVYIIETVEACSKKVLSHFRKQEFLKREIGILNQEFKAVLADINSGYHSTSDAVAHKTHIDALRTSYMDTAKQLATSGIGEAESTKLGKLLTSFKGFLTAEMTAYTANEAAWSKGKVNALANLEAKESKLQQQLSKAETQLLTVTEIKWIPNTSGTNPITEEFNENGIYDWFDKDYINKKGTASAVKKYLNNNKITISMDSCTKQGSGFIDSKLKTAIYYRIPQRCNVKITMGDAGDGAVARIIVLKNIPFSQFGFIASLAIDNGPFEDSDYAIAFDPKTGQLKTYTFKSKKSALLEASTALAKTTEILKETDVEEINKEKEEVKAENSLLTEKNLFLDKKIEQLKKEASLKKLEAGEEITEKDTE